MYTVAHNPDDGTVLLKEREVKMSSTNWTLCPQLQVCLTLRTRKPIGRFGREPIKNENREQ